MTLHNRRRFLQIAGLAGGGLLLENTLLGGAAHAAEGAPKFMLMVYFGGGWDQLLALDPRDATLPQYQYSGDAAPTSGIYPAYAESAAANPAVAAVMSATGGRGVQNAGGLTFGPAVSAELTQHGADLCIIRGLNMNTVTHEVGRRYFITGKFPRGVAAAGSSLNTVFVGRAGSSLDLPNLAMNVESYNDGFGANASAIGTNNADDVQNVLTAQAQNPGLLPSSEVTLATYGDQSDSCEAHGYDASGLVGAFRSSRVQAQRIVKSSASAYFAFQNPPPNDDVAQLFTEMKLDPKKELDGPKARAAVAAQAISKDVSQVVALNLGGSLDSHFDLALTHSQLLNSGFEALGLLIKCLKNRQYKATGQSYWDFTTLFCFSEFARTPLMNVRDGRDHHLTSSCLVAGPGIKGGTVFGASSDLGMGVQKWNLATGALDEAAGASVRPADVHATLLKSMQLDYSHLSNQSPQIIAPILKG